MIKILKFLFIFVLCANAFSADRITADKVKIQENDWNYFISINGTKICNFKLKHFQTSKAALSVAKIKKEEVDVDAKNCSISRVPGTDTIDSLRAEKNVLMKRIAQLKSKLTACNDGQPKGAKVNNSNLEKMVKEIIENTEKTKINSKGSAQ